MGANDLDGEELVALAKLRLEEMLEHFPSQTAVRGDFNDGQIVLEVDTDSTGRLIGHRGETLQALQHLLNVIIKNYTPERVYVSIDVAGYKKERAEQLTAHAQEEAKKVVETGKPVELRPMNASERRVVHMALSNMPEVVTESEGEGTRRRVVIKHRDA